MFTNLKRCMFLKSVVRNSVPTIPIRIIITVPPIFRYVIALRNSLVRWYVQCFQCRPAVTFRRADLHSDDGRVVNWRRSAFCCVDDVDALARKCINRKRRLYRTFDVPRDSVHRVACIQQSQQSFRGLVQPYYLSGRLQMKQLTGNVG